VAAARLPPQLLRAVAAGQQVLGDLYDTILKEIRARGEPAESETRLWACLARLKDPKTGVCVGGGARGWFGSVSYLRYACRPVARDA
jgi:hypothetical protein